MQQANWSVTRDKQQTNRERRTERHWEGQDGERETVKERQTSHRRQALSVEIYLKPLILHLPPPDAITAKEVEVSKACPRHRFYNWWHVTQIRPQTELKITAGNDRSAAGNTDVMVKWLRCWAKGFSMRLKHQKHHWNLLGSLPPLWLRARWFRTSWSALTNTFLRPVFMHFLLKQEVGTWPFKKKTYIQNLWKIINKKHFAAGAKPDLLNWK